MNVKIVDQRDKAREREKDGKKRPRQEETARETEGESQRTILFHNLVWKGCAYIYAVLSTGSSNPYNNHNSSSTLLVSLSLAGARFPC